MKTDRCIRVSLLILSGGVIAAIACAIFAIAIAIFAPDFAQEHFLIRSTGIVRQLAMAGMISGFIIGIGTMSFVMLFATIAHWASPQKDQTG